MFDHANFILSLHVYTLHLSLFDLYFTHKKSFYGNVCIDFKPTLFVTCKGQSQVKIKIPRFLVPSDSNFTYAVFGNWVYCDLEYFL